MNRKPLYIVAVLLAMTAGWAAERLFAGRGAPEGLTADRPSSNWRAPTAGTLGQSGNAALGNAALGDAALGDTGLPNPRAIPTQ